MVGKRPLSALDADVTQTQARQQALCRFCTRKRMVARPSGSVHKDQIEASIDYIAGNKNIDDVLLSGGDPLTFDDQRLDEILAHRARVAGWYMERLADENRISLQRIPADCNISWFVMVVRLSDDYTREDRDNILAGLRAKEIGTNNYFTPIHLQPFYVEQGWKRGDLPVCEALADRTVALPFHGLLTEREVDIACREFRNLLNQPYRP